MRFYAWISTLQHLKVRPGFRFEFGDGLDHMCEPYCVYQFKLSRLTINDLGFPNRMCHLNGNVAQAKYCTNPLEIQIFGGNAPGVLNEFI